MSPKQEIDVEKENEFEKGRWNVMYLFLNFPSFQGCAFETQPSRYHFCCCKTLQVIFIKVLPRKTNVSFVRTFK